MSDLAAPLPVSRSAVSQHLRVMLRVGVVAERHAGRERHYRLERAPLDEVEGWLGRADQFWADRLQRLGGRLAGSVIDATGVPGQLLSP